MQILLVEDDVKISEFVRKGLEQNGFRVECAFDGVAGLNLARQESFDLAIIDLMLPKMDGFTLIEEIRKFSAVMPIIILSARDSVASKVKGLEKGSDDYLAKPFSLAELLARVQALLRRAFAQSGEPTVLKIEDLTLDLATRKVFRSGERIDLQPLEYQLLEYLMRNKGRVVSRTTIMQHVWEYNFDPQTNIVESRVCRLREKIDKPYERKLIHTVRGFGYVLE